MAQRPELLARTLVSTRGGRLQSNLDDIERPVRY